MKKELIQTQMKVKDNLVGVMRVGDVDYISLTDLAKYKYEDEYGSSSEITLCARTFNSDVQNNEIRARLNEM